MKNEEKTTETAKFIEKLKTYEKLAKEEKELKSSIKKKSAELQKKIKITIENLSDEQVYMLLEKKWIEPFGDGEGRKKEYKITELGKNVAEKELLRLQELTRIAGEIIRRK